MPVNCYHSVLLSRIGEAFVCGDNSGGQLGTEDNECRTTLVKIRAPRLVSISAGNSFHTVAIAADGSIWSCGSNSHGQLGLPQEETTVNTMTRVPGFDNMVSVSAGSQFTITLDRQGRVWAFGSNESWQLGISECDESISVFKPTMIQNLVRICQVAAGNNHSMMLDTEGYVFSCGSNKFGQLGHGDTKYRTTPELIPTLGGIKSISCGHYHNLCLDVDGRVYAFGNNGSGQLGTGTIGFYVSYPRKMALKLAAIRVICGGSSSFCTLSDGSVWLCGDNFFGQLGFDDTLSTAKLIENPKLFNMEIVPGSTHVFSIDQNGNVYSCGDNSYSQNGQGDDKEVRDFSCINYITLPIPISNVKSAKSSNRQAH